MKTPSTYTPIILRGDSCRAQPSHCPAMNHLRRFRRGVRCLTLVMGMFLTLPLILAAVPNATNAQAGRNQRLASADAVPMGLKASDWSSIREQYERLRHAAIPVKGGYQARNPGQRWQTCFDGCGFITRPDAADWQWGLELRSYGFTGHERAAAGQPRVTTEGQRVAYDWDDNIREWFVNDTHGLEHGFTIHARPAGANGRLLVTLAVRGGLRPETQPDGRGVRFLDGRGEAKLTYAGLTVLDADGHTLNARFEAVIPGGNFLTLAVDEHDAHYPLTIDPIAQQAYLKAFNSGAHLTFGVAVAVSGDTVVVGASDDHVSSAHDNTDGAVYVFVRSAGGLWSLQDYLRPSNRSDGTGSGAYVYGFGVSVAIWGDTIVVGAPGEYESSSVVINGPSNQPIPSGNCYCAPGAGAAYIFVRNNGTWSQQAYLKASNNSLAGGANFGGSVAINDATVVVGALGEANNAIGVDNSGTGPTEFSSIFTAPGSGAAYVFVRSGSLLTDPWNQQAYLKASNTEMGDEFGISVSISGNTVVVGASYEDSNATMVNAPLHGGLGTQDDNNSADSGAAYVFLRTGTIWAQQAYLKPSNPGMQNYFGTSVAVSGDTVVVGALYEPSDVHAVINSPPDPAPLPGANSGALDSGAAYVFARSGTTWNQEAYLKSSNNDPIGGLAFGISVAVSGNIVVVGSAYENGGVIGVVNSPPDPLPAPGVNNTAISSGAAYVFRRDTGTYPWSQVAYLKASNNDSYGADFGTSVAIDGTTVVVGSEFEDNSGTTVINDPPGTLPAEPTVANSDHNAQFTGAAYIFLIPSCYGNQSFVANGSFEHTSPVIGANTAQYNLDPATGIPGWVTTGNFLEVWGNTFGGIPASDGNNQLEINAQSDNQTVSQLITGLNPGCAATLCFDYTGRFGVDPATGTPNNNFTATLSGGSTMSVSLDPYAYAVGGWLTFCTNFYPTASSVTLAFHGQPHLSDGTTTYEGGAHIDNVSITQCCCPPAPILNKTFNGSSITFSWNSPSYRLQCTTVLGQNAIWTDVPGNSPITVTISGGSAKYFRLICP